MENQLEGDKMESDWLIKVMATIIKADKIMEA